MSDDEAEHGLIFPFVVCKSNGGTYDDEAFVAGAYFGSLQQQVERGVELIETYVPSPLIDQIDLLAMHHDYSFQTLVWSEHPEEWTWITLGAPPKEGA